MSHGQPLRCFRRHSGLPKARQDPWKKWRERVDKLEEGYLLDNMVSYM